jgi:hypothetical protein
VFRVNKCEFCQEIETGLVIVSDGKQGFVCMECITFTYEETKDLYEEE